MKARTPAKACFLGLLALLAWGQAGAEEVFGPAFARRATANLPPAASERESSDSEAEATRPRDARPPVRPHSPVVAAAYDVPSPAAPPVRESGSSEGGAEFDAETPGILSEELRQVQPKGSGLPAGESSAQRREGPSGFPALGPRSRSGRGGDGSAPSPVTGIRSAVTVISSLAIVLGLFFVTAWLMRRVTPAGQTLLPSDVFEVLGRAPLAGRQQVHLVRCGTKLLLVSVTPEAAETLTEIDDPDEVTRLAGLCRASQPGSATAVFRQVLQQFSNQPIETGLAESGGLRGRAGVDCEFPRTREERHG